MELKLALQLLVIDNSSWASGFCVDNSTLRYYPDICPWHLHMVIWNVSSPSPSVWFFWWDTGNPMLSLGVNIQFLGLPSLCLDKHRCCLHLVYSLSHPSWSKAAVFLNGTTAWIHKLHGWPFLKNIVLISLGHVTREIQLNKHCFQIIGSVSFLINNFLLNLLLLHFIIRI